MIDLHCHFLPGVDDGARTIEESMALVRVARDSGITAAVMTPHIYPGVFDNSEETLVPAFAQYAVGLLCLAPVALVLARMNIGNLSGAGEAFLLLSPFLLAMVLLYAVLCFIAAKIGRAARRRLRGVK